MSDNIPDNKKDKLATTIIIKVNDEVVGVVQSVEISENRKVDVETGETETTTVKVTANRIRFDRKRISEAFNKGFVHRSAQRLPFQIEIDSPEAITSIKDVWIDSLDLTWSTDDWVILDGMELEGKSISSIMK